MRRQRVWGLRSEVGHLPTIHIAFVSWLFLFAGTVQADDLVPANDAREHIGKVVTVEGTVTVTRVEGRNVFLSFGSEEENSFIAVISPPLLLSGFPAHPEDYYQGKTVRIKGAIFSIHGKPGVLVTDPARIEVVGARHASPLLVPQSATSRPQVARAPDACQEAQKLWQHVAADLVPHLRSLGSCLERGTPECQDNSESVAAGLFSLQQAQKRLKTACP